METLALWLVLVVASALLIIATCYMELLWRWYGVVADLAAALLIVGLPFLLMSKLSVIATSLLLVLTVWLLLLAARIRFGRLDKLFLRPSTIKNVLLIAVIMALTLLWVRFMPSIGLELLGVILLSASVALGVVFAWQAIWTYRFYKIRKTGHKLQNKDLPTVSLCIPARNETAVLRDCLVAATASDYPKLEILVLDDCSHDATSEVILDFAQDGVRFVKGALPADGWLGRNQAMSTLAHHASGECLIFASVDTLLGPHSISEVVNYAWGKVDMVSILPVTKQGLAARTVFATLRYYWQMVLPVSKWHVPVSGKFWLIRANTLRELGSFESVKHKVVPEESFARRLFAKDTYRFLVGDRQLELATSKPWKDQVSTSLRLMYPTLQRQPVLVLGSALALAGLFVLPFTMLVAMVIVGNFGVLFWLALLSSLLLTFGYGLVASRLQPQSWATSTLCLPVLYTQELIMLMASMLAYEFSEVSWKGRNVCYPVISRGQRSRPAAGELGQKTQHARPGSSN